MSQVKRKRVTNADLADAIEAIAKRLTILETEARVGKWVIRLVAGMVASVIAHALLKR